MEYEKIKTGYFLARPNRFIAHVEIDGQVEIVHVKNTGRCKELLVKGATVLVQECENINRKTKYDLISVYKENRLINMDSQAPNKAFYEWIKKGNLFQKASIIKPEAKYKNSRFDFYVEAPNRKIFIEVKGVTLEENNVVLFPDAPTIRGVKHIDELCDSVKDGYEAYIVFVIQMKDVSYFTPNVKTHQAFGDALIRAVKSGVRILAVDCKIATTSMEIADFVKVKL